MHHFQNLPLPSGVVRAGYFRDMRELVAYDITTDSYPVRYDWIDDAGVPHHFMPEPIRATDVIGKHDLLAGLTICRIAVMKSRGIE